MNKLIEKIELPLKENPDLANPPKGSYHDGYRSAIINILAIIKAENLAIAGVGKAKRTCPNCGSFEIVAKNIKGDEICFECDEDV